MMNTFHQNIAILIGRALIALLFIPAGLAKVSGFEGTVGYIASVGMPFSTVAAVLAIMIELGAGAALLVGFYTRVAAVVLAIFTLVASFYFHSYWSVAADQAFVTQLLFFKNIAVVGGLLVIAAVGAGGWSLDERNNHANSGR